MNQKGHITDQKGLKMYEKGKKWSFWIKNTFFVTEYSLAEWGGGTPLSPLTKNLPAQKPLAERGVPPPP